MKFLSKIIIPALIVFIFLIPKAVDACTIFCSAKDDQVLAAGNEDWSNPFSKMWITEKTDTDYGIINLGHSDYQIQTAMNEHGLYFDFAAIPKAEGKNMKGKVKSKRSLFSEILAKCRNIDEALVYLNKYQYPSPYNQVLMADAEGNSIIVNQDEIRRSSKDYQIATNFNSCDLSSGMYDCERYEIIERGLSDSDEISVSLFRKLLSNSHQEGPYPTQYSYVFDLKNGVINLYSFHNFENVVTLNVQEELSKKYKMINLKDLFPKSFEELYFRTNHRDTLVHEIISEINKHGVDSGINLYKEAVINNPDAASYPFVLLSVGGALVHEAWFEDNKGKVFDYWFHPQNVLNWKSINKDKIKEILKVYDYLEETIPKENPKQFIGTYELKGLLYFLIDEKEKSKEYFEKTITVAPTETSNYKRANSFLKEYF